MENTFNTSCNNAVSRKLFACLLILFSIVCVNVGLNIQDANAQNVLPPSALDEFPGLDPRIVGVPIVKKDNTAALVAYSEAINELRALEDENTSLKNDLAVLQPELLRAQALAKERNDEYELLKQSYKSLVVSQYQDLSSSRGQNKSSSEPDELRLNHQSEKASSSIRAWRDKAEKKSKEAGEYANRVDEKIITSSERINSIGKDIEVAKKKAKDRKTAARSAIPVALIESLEIPVLTMDAYLKTEQIMAAKKPECGLTWWALAGIGRAESNHGTFRGSTLDQSGTVSPPIIGVALNGEGFAAIGDSDGGLLDGDTQWDRAVGVMQFIPGTWRGYAEDANGDGLIDPQNVYDAALAAGKLLCANARPDMRTPEGRRTAFLRYNASKKYADFVEAKGKSYEAIGAGRFNPAPIVP